MNNGLIIDAAFALVLLAGIGLGAKRGLVRSLMGLVSIVVALIGAAILSGLLAQPITEAMMPRAEESLAAWFQQDARDEEKTAEAAEAEEESLPDATGLLQRLLRIDSDGTLRDSLREHAQEAALAAVRSLLESFVRALAFVLSFLVLMLLLRLFTGGLDKLFSLPVLHTFNALGGGALGLIESALLLFLLCDVAPRLGAETFAQYENTYLLAFFMQQTPRSIAAALIPRS